MVEIVCKFSHVDILGACFLFVWISYFVSYVFEIIVVPQVSLQTVHLYFIACIRATWSVCHNTWA